MKSRVLFVAALLTLLAGCASTPHLNPDDQARLGTVRIDPVIDTPKDMYFFGPGSAFGMMGGAIGGLITAEANKGPGERLKQFALDNGIHIDQIAREEATKAFEQSGKFKLTDTQGPGVATLKITIPIYGFSIPNGFSGDLVPIVGIKCVLTDASGKVIWSANDLTNALGNPAEGKTPDELRANPKLIEEDWRIAIKTMMANIVHHM